MKKKQKQELVRNILYALSGVIVGGAVGGALLMKMVTEGDNRRAQAEAVAEQSIAETAAETSHTETEPAAEETTTETVTETAPPPDADALRTLMKPAAPLLTMTYCYTDADCYETYSEVWGKKMPFTTDSVILTCDGTISMAVDADAVLYEVDADAMQITATLPAPKVISHELDEGSIRYYDVKSSLFRKPTLSDYSALIREMKENIRARVVSEREFDRMTLEQAETVIRSCLSVSEVTADYAVTVILPELPAADAEPDAPADFAPLPPADSDEDADPSDWHTPSFRW